MNTTATFVQTYHVQFSFHFDETQRLLTLAHALPEGVYRATNDYSHMSVHNTFAHLLSASQLWRHVLSNTQPTLLSAEAIADIDALVTLFAIEREGWRQLLTTLDSETLLSTIERQTPFGLVQLAVWQTLQHVILHGIVHHAELARIFTEAGQSPGDIDFLFYRARGDGVVTTSDE